MKKIVYLFILLFWSGIEAQTMVKVFENQPVNFTGNPGDTTDLVHLQDGRILLKKITVPEFEEGTDVMVKMTLRSAGDPWDKSGSLFVITDPEKIDVIDIAKDLEKYPEAAGIEGYPGIVKTESYTPALEILRFMTPFGVGYFSNEEVGKKRKYNRPVYIPKWEDKVVWEENVSHLASELTGEIYVGVWIDTWTADGYIIDVDLEYSGRPLKEKKVVPLVNTIYYAGQKHPDLFAKTDLTSEFELPENAKNVKLHYITTGHGGHSGGDEFIKLKNTLKFDNKEVLNTIPWRDDCASFRRFNPSSGVWVKQDSGYAYNNGKKELMLLKERIASSDLSRSNWCPGSKVSPIEIELGDLEKGKHALEISIDGTPIEGDKLNHWLVSAYLTYE